MKNMKGSQCRTILSIVFEDILLHSLHFSFLSFLLQRGLKFSWHKSPNYKPYRRMGMDIEPVFKRRHSVFGGGGLQCPFALFMLKYWA
jgi:hypothetical protein